MKVFKMRNPHLADVIFNALEDAVADNLPFMDSIFGRVERIESIKNGKRYNTPNIYSGNDNYTQILPDSSLGNFCFFVLQEPTSLKKEIGTLTRFKSDFSVIFWLDMRKIEDEDTRDTERVKERILSALNSAKLTEGAVVFNEIYERAENVFRGFTLDEVDNNFLVSPFYGFRIDGQLTIKENCYNE